MIQKRKKLLKILHRGFLSTPRAWYSAPMNSMTRKEFLEQVQSLCELMSYEELVDCIKLYVREYRSEQRQEFLHALASYRGDAPPEKLEIGLLEAVDALADNILDYQKSIEDGSFYDDQEYPYDECPDPYTDDHLGSLAGLFNQADLLFSSGGIEDARKLYSRLFELIESFEDLKYWNRQFSVDWIETQARYWRCMYETEPPEKRPQVLLSLMDPRNFNSSYYGFGEPYVKDIIGTREEILPDYEQFLASWCRLLAEGSTDREQMLLLEAVHMTRGIDGISELARSWKGTQSRGYLYWISALKDAGDLEQVLEVSQEALKAISPEDPLRYHAAAYLTQTAEKTGSLPQLLAGKQELFQCETDDFHLEHLMKEAQRQHVLDQQLDWVHSYLKTHVNEHTIPLMIKVMFILGSGVQVYADPKSLGISSSSLNKPLGWSWIFSGDAVTGLLFAGALIMLAGDHICETPIIHSVHKTYDPTVSSGRSFVIPGDADPEYLRQMAVSGLISSPLPKDTRDYLHAWAMEIGKKRIEGIVSNKYRNSYRKAAEILGALAEVAAVTQSPKHAQTLIFTYRDQMFQRFSAFRREVNGMMELSSLLSSL